MCLLISVLIYFIGVGLIILISYIENYNRPVYLKEDMKMVYRISIFSWLLIFAMVVFEIIDSDWFNKIKEIKQREH